MFPPDRSDDPDSDQEAALAWLARRHGGAWSRADQQELDRWLAADPARAAAWREAQQTWERLEGLHPLAAQELHRARRGRATIPVRRRAGLALAGVCVLALAVVAWLPPGSLDGAQHVQTARGEQRTVALPDGSEIELNTDTRIHVDYGPLCRCLRLESGEAVFRVAHGDRRKFEVVASRGNIRDIGTVFWVRAEPAHVSVAVLEGAIEVALGPYTPLQRMSAGDRLAYDYGGRLIDGGSAPLADLLAWRKGDIVFHDAGLREVFAEFARYYPLQLDIDPRLFRYRLSGRFASADLEGLLDLIESGYPIHVQRLARDRIRLAPAAENDFSS
jgi:transmembrane sensor